MHHFTPEKLTREELAGQRIIAGFEGTELDSDLKYLIDTLKVGGLILFKRNISSPEQLKHLCRSAQAYAFSKGLPPLFTAVDQEGGTVARLKEPFTLFPEGNQGITCTADAEHFARITAQELHSVGLNMNMAPVLDVQPEGFTGIMEKRVFPGNARTVAELGTAMISRFQQEKIIAVAKHFPGIGRTTLDSHLKLPILDTLLQELETSDLIPFQEAVNANVSAIMMSHILYTSMDDSNSASISKKITGLLRDKMGFNGVIMTDDLDMKALTLDIQTITAKIIDADIDIPLICRNRDHIIEAHRFISDQIKKNPETRHNCLKSVKRIFTLKQNYLKDLAP